MMRTTIFTLASLAALTVGVSGPISQPQAARADLAAAFRTVNLLGDSCCTPAPAPACCPASTCCKDPCIEYRHALFCHKVCCDSCEPNIKTVLKVKNPCTCCVVDVPVCLPLCCKGEPEPCSWCGALGRPNVRYDYCCGVSVVVTFKNCGDVIVTYRGA